MALTLVVSKLHSRANLSPNLQLPVMLSTFSIALKPQTRKTKKKILNFLKNLTDFKSRTGWVSFQEPWQCHDLNLLQSMFH
jgi:hypothetical protein